MSRQASGRGRPVRKVRKVGIGVIGGLVTLAGVAMLVLPGPALVVIPLGLAILATEFAFAARAKREVERKARKATRKAKARAARRDSGGRVT